LIDLRKIIRDAAEKNIPITRKSLLQWRYEFVLKISKGILELITLGEGLESIITFKKTKEELLDLSKSVKKTKLKHNNTSLLLCGPHGTGKKSIAKAFLRDCNIPALCLNHQNLSNHTHTSFPFEMIESLLTSITPCAVLITNAHRVFPRAGETSSNQSYQLEMYDRLKKHTGILWMFITTRPDLLNETITRDIPLFHRFIITDPGDREELMDVLETMLISLDIDVNRFPEIEALLPRLIGYTAVDFQEIENLARENAIQEGRKEYSTDDIHWAVENYIPLYDPEEREFYDLIAAKICRFRKHLPLKYRNLDYKQIARRLQFFSNK